jgi:hypothetical protein
MYRSPILSDKIHLLPHVHIIRNPNVQSPPSPPPFEAWQNSAKKGKIFQYFRLGVALHKFQKDFFDSFKKRTRRNGGGVSINYHSLFRIMKY